MLASPKLLEAVFAGDSIKNKLNTEAVEVGSNQLVSARVVQHMPSRVMPLAEVQAQVREPGVLVHVAVPAAHPPLFVRHSLMSVQVSPSPA